MSGGRVAEIEAGLASEDAEERRVATAELAAMDTESALPLLLRALGDADWRVRKEATIAARPHVEYEETLDALVATMRPGDNVGLRNAAVEVLANAGAAAVHAVDAAFDSLDPDGRKLAVEAFGRSACVEAIAPLERALRDEDVNVREAAIEAIAQLGALRRDRASAVLLDALDDRDAFVVLTALEGLTNLGAPVPWPRLVRLFDDPVVRPGAISAAAISETEDAATAIARAMSQSSGSAFTHAMRAMGRLAQGPLAEAAARALRDEGAELAARLVAGMEPGRPRDDRAIAMKLAAMARVAAAVPRAIDALSEEVLAPGAEEALVTFGEAAAPALLARLEAESAPETRAALVEIVARIAEEKADEALLKALRSAVRDTEHQVATKALLALAHVGTDLDLQIAAVQALSESQAVARAAEAALVALADRYPIKARANAEAMTEQEAFFFPAAVLLGAIPKDATRIEHDMAFLAHAATAGDPNARRAAMDAVAALDGPGATEVLSFALADEEHEVAVAAARGLGLLAARSAVRGDHAAQLRRVVDLVEGTGASDLVAATLRALGASGADRAHTDEIFATLAGYAKTGPSLVAIAAIDALGASLGETKKAAEALSAALQHVDVDVVRAAMLKLGDTGEGREKLVACLEHLAADVRLLAVEILADSDPEITRDSLLRRAAVEPDRHVKAALEHALSMHPPKDEG